ncbi:FxSxx-COOH system tetratricopeptide repeat protein [Nonomuraea sp. NPDC049158]|uniref:FxSxx-COOH system tetratricopeptide repeat protein n=1 Tax=Nonomuraea sp. NPDC049158 TaxID=3155649 RepID=UPI00340BC877
MESQLPGTWPTTGGFPTVWNVPPRNRNFTGREALLSRLRSGIGEQVTAMVPHALHGLGGVGKTQMAIEYAYRFRDSYDVVWYIPADQPGLVRSTLARLAPQLGVAPATTTGIEEAANSVLEALRRGEPYSRWLLIFDNADEPEDLSEIVPPGPGHVLITSRNHRWESVVDTVAVDVFPRAESVEFFKKRMRRPIAEKDADQLAEALGDLPLALEQSAALQAETGMSADEYLRLLAERTTSLLSEGKPTEYPLSMTAAWGLSVTKLREHLPEAMELLRCCATFGPEPIPRAVFRPVEGPVRPEIAHLLADPIRLSKAISRLGKYALVRIDSGTAGERTLQVHRLIQALLREELTSETRHEIQSEVHSLLVGAAPKGPDDPANWSVYEGLLAHVGPARVAVSRREDVRDFALDVLTYLSASGNHQATQSHVETFLRQWTADSGPEDPHVLRAQRARGDLLRSLGRYNDAFELNSATLVTMRRTMGNEHRDTLALLNGLGADLRARGLFLDARDHDADSVRLHKSVLGDGHVLTLRAINNLAIDYGLTSDYRGSRALLDEALRTAQLPGQGVSRGTVLNLWTGLGRAVRQCGDYVEACDVGEDALAYGRELLDPDHPRILLTQKDLAIAQLRSGELDDALELARDVHARYVRVYDLDHPGTLAAATSLSNCLRHNGHLEEALVLASDTMERNPNMYGAEHPYNYGCVSNVALLHRVLGRPQAARELNEQALEGLERRLGRDHHYALTVAINLASDLAALGDIKAACTLGKDTHHRLSRLLGDRHPTTLAAAANLAADLAAAGHQEESQALFEETMRLFAETLGPEHRDAQVAGEGRHLDCDFDPPPI